MDLLMFIIMFIVWSIINVRIENNRIRNLRRKARKMQRNDVTSVSIGNAMNNGDIRNNSYSNYNLGYRYRM